MLLARLATLAVILVINYKEEVPIEVELHIATFVEVIILHECFNYICINKLYIDVDEYQTNNGGCNCAESIPRESGCFSQCNNTMGAFFCTCNAGFIVGSDYLTCYCNTSYTAI